MAQVRYPEPFTGSLHNLFTEERLFHRHREAANEERPPMDSKNEASETERTEDGVTVRCPVAPDRANVFSSRRRNRSSPAACTPLSSAMPLRALMLRFAGTSFCQHGPGSVNAAFTTAERTGPP